jgi:hypothetical protein
LNLNIFFNLWLFPLPASWRVPSECCVHIQIYRKKCISSEKLNLSLYDYLSNIRTHNTRVWPKKQLLRSRSMFLLLCFEPSTWTLLYFTCGSNDRMSCTRCHWQCKEYTRRSNHEPRTQSQTYNLISFFRSTNNLINHGCELLFHNKKDLI